MKKIFLFLAACCSLSLHAAVDQEYPVVILGGGVASLTSATYLARSGIQPLVLSGPLIGGAITMSHHIQNWPGEEEISGSDLAEKLRHQAEANGAIIRPEIVVKVDFSKRPFLITTQEPFSDGSTTRTIAAQSVIIGLGATPKFLNIPGESEYWTRGVYSCAVCDGGFYKDKIVAIVGGGDSALVEAQYLSNLARKVILIVRKGQFRSIETQRMQQVLSRPNVQVIYEHIVREIKGNEEHLTHLTLENTQTKATQALPVDALFLAIGAQPNTELFRAQLELDPAGYIVLKNHQETSVPGVYAIGDIADPEFKQAVTASADGAKAALQAHKHLSATPAIAQAAPAITGPSVIEITSKEHFAQEIASATGPIFVDFYSTHCGPCRMFSPTYETWAKDFRGRIKFLKINADKAPQLFEQYHVRAVPTLVVFDSSGKLIRKGAGGQEISYLSRILNQLREQPTIEPSSFK
jgi:thioredoxin reductase (NADPH)